ncbi:Hypothetical predicted protein [Olea europaea subsp. europaea]|uniref:Uncharacterized protein n=1 Tax=Olea europaea subsp. europaea TaxID=158383 RepID=A0A8S0T6J0_OLEEU|nr:Hypothetical predicted protein [Olea europaea subsp. europaea]
MVHSNDSSIRLFITIERSPWWHHRRIDAEATSLSSYRRCHHSSDKRYSNGVVLLFTVTLNVALSFATGPRLSFEALFFVAIVRLLNKTPLLQDNTAQCCVHQHILVVLGTVDLKMEAVAMKY